MGKILVLALMNFLAGAVHAQVCNSKIEELQKAFNDKKASCAQENLQTGYIETAFPTYAQKIPTCISTGQTCITTCDQYDSKSSSCYTSKSAAVPDNSGLAAAADAAISSVQQAYGCVESTFNDCAGSMTAASRACITADEGIFRANDQCDVDMTNFSLRARNLKCENAPEVAAFEAARDDLVSQINSYTKQMNSWGQQVKTNVMANRKSCEKSHDRQVARKTKITEEIERSEQDARRVKRAVSSQK